MSIDPHHNYDPIGRVLYMGDGTRIASENLTPVIKGVAGTQLSGGYNGDGGLALDASLYFPAALLVGPDGSLYIAITGTGDLSIRRVDPSGIISTVAGTEGLGIFGGLAMASDGTLYISDSTNSIVRAVSPSGGIRTVAGTGIAGYSGDGGPATEAELQGLAGIDVGPDGTLYISAWNRVRAVGTDGIITTVAGGGSSTPESVPALEANIGRPYDVSSAADGNLYIYNGIKVLKVDMDGVITRVAGMDDAGYNGDGIPALNAKLGGSDASIDVDLDNSIYIVDTNNYRIRVVDPMGIISTIAGTGIGTSSSPDNLPATATNLRQVKGIALAPDGTLYFSDYWEHYVRKIIPYLPAFSLSESIVASRDGGELYFFDSRGRHEMTVNAFTGSTLYSFGYDEDNELFTGLLTSIQDGYGNITSIERESEGSLSAIVAPFGQTTDITLDANGYVDLITNPNGEHHDFDYSLNPGEDGLMTSRVDPRDETYSYQYNVDTETMSSFGTLKKAQDPAGGSKDLAYQLMGNATNGRADYEVTLTTGMGRETSYLTEFLATGDVERTTTFPNGLQVKSTSLTDGTKQVIYPYYPDPDPDGMTFTTKQFPDPRWGMEAPIVESLVIDTPAIDGPTLNLSTTRQIELSDLEDMMSLVFLEDQVTVNTKLFKSTFTYDALTPERRWTYHSAENREQYVILNDQGRPTKYQVADLSPIYVSYDGYGRIDTLIQGSGGDQRIYNVDYYPPGETYSGYVSSITNPLGETWSFAYDGAGRVNKQTLPDGRFIDFSYDANGNITSITPPSRPPHGLTYTPVNLAEYYNPPGLVDVPVVQTHYQYNLDRQIDLITRPDGNTFNPEYDYAGRLETIETTTYGSTNKYTYNYEGPDPGKIYSVTAPGGEVITFDFDGSLLLSETWSVDVAGSVSRTYNDDFNLDSLSINGNLVSEYGYEDDGLLTQAGQMSIVRYAQHGLINNTTLGSVTTSQAYNSFGEIDSFSASYSGSPLLSVSYTSRDKLGRITTLTETVQEESPSTYTYVYEPSTGRLQDVYLNGTEPGNLISHYTYDSNGNRLLHQTLSGTRTGSYDSQDRMTFYNEVDYDYTANGELSAKTTLGNQTTTYTYDELGNLMTVTLPGGPTIEYIIDGLNRRIGKKVEGVMTQGFLYANTLQPVAEMDGTGAVVSTFVYGTKINAPDYMVRDGTTYRIISDHVGSPRLVVNVATGIVAQRMEYDEFGNVLNDTSPGFQPFGFAGGIYDRDTGLVRFGARDYDPLTGRWTAKDPILFWGGDTNLYGYVLNDPVNWVDPLGYWYIDMNISAPFLGGVAGLTGGVQISQNGIYGYVGPMLSTPGLGAAITASPLDPSEGWNWGLQLGSPYLIGGQVGQTIETDDPFIEFGLVSPGGSWSRYYVEELWTWKDICS